MFQLRVPSWNPVWSRSRPNSSKCENRTFSFDSRHPNLLERYSTKMWSNRNSMRNALEMPGRRTIILHGEHVVFLYFVESWYIWNRLTIPFQVVWLSKLTLSSQKWFQEIRNGRYLVSCPVLDNCFCWVWWTPVKFTLKSLINCTIVSRRPYFQYESTICTRDVLADDHYFRTPRKYPAKTEKYYAAPSCIAICNCFIFSHLQAVYQPEMMATFVEN